jgi:translocation and assembly module TamB
LKHLELEVELDHGQARLTSGQVLVQGQRVRLIGEVPLGREFWDRLGQKQLPDWRRATAHLQVQDAEIAAFQPLIPTLLAPQGELDVDVILRRGGKLEGEIVVDHARTRPLGPMGPVRDISANIRLRNEAVELRNATANIGGSTVTVSGQLDLSGPQWMKGEIPPFAVSIHGTSVPLVRQPECIVRSDLLLGVVKTNGAPPLISGTAGLRDSYYLSDLRALIPGKVAAPALRPPYFSIDDPLIAGWRLAVNVQGTRFLKVRSPLFNGELSANLKLQGTLKDPIALGDLKIDSGLVRFPFASLQVQRGVVNLTSQNPYHPELRVLAASKQFGYDIHMDVSGPVDAPIIQFSSTPPLSSEQILLMVSAGELPQGTYSLSPQQRAQTVALFLGRDLLSKLGIGDQGEQRLTIRSGEEISEQGRSTYYIEYKLSDRWSVTGEYDRFGDYNAGFKWRVYSK